MRSGFTYSESYSWEMALRWYGLYSREEFEQLDGLLQSRIIALWQIHQQSEAIVATEQIREMRRASQR